MSDKKNSGKTLLSEKEKKNRSRALIGAAFLMATSAVGPGFLTQTAVFTETLLASFGFVILVSIILDIGAQLNVWRIIAVSGKRGQEIASAVIPGLGIVVALFIVIGGLAFNIGNIGGTGLGLNALLGINPKVGAIISAAICIFIFLSKEAGAAMDRIVNILGAVLLVLIAYVMFVSQPPVGDAVYRTFVPLELDFYAIITIVGGTVGGYITFSGGHRLLDAGIKGKESIPEVTKTSITGIIVASLVRILLFLAVLGVVYAGVHLDPSNPAATVFQYAAGDIGYRIFGLVLWIAGISSVIGAAYTSVSFLRTFHPKIEQYYQYWIIGFILFSTIVFVFIGEAATLLVLAGAVNGLILPLTLGPMLFAAHNKKIVGDYKHPLWLTVFGAIVVILTAYLGVRTLIQMIPQLF
ncbi:divalent metal cation transporter [Oceanobacillus caeni]|uniref:NRAMP family divalent metal transporter n=1 Tax=Bacillaceae TaxID=186817 RepID=UPI0006215E18|nr:MULTISPECIES: NRAMP family divalent metal transporter [Bacillaceae]KKE80203.1 membrane protein [Bacilli bacterium VT-13-104]PZD83346.1 divalent metal cation transporter [Bacilli bacterium]MCR1832915.1 divalent metal cation transporter [Oceanobacillus caeni]PZD84943.1 divalent metal cation transporter [Bacilli bacterium]PZD88046.1 divalent metal cation transporter [Bacilli bacterium]